MKRMILTALMLFASLALTGCGNDDYYYYPLPYGTQILSDPAFDGDISKDSATGTFSVVQGMTPTVQSVNAGTNPTTRDESRAFLNFPLTGAFGVPENAYIVSADLNVFINIIQTSSGSIPVRIDLVSTHPTLVGSDYNSPVLASISVTFLQSNSGQFVNIDVTPLMAQAQYLHLPVFQVRVSVTYHLDLWKSMTSQMQIGDITPPC